MKQIAFVVFITLTLFLGTFCFAQTTPCPLPVVSSISGSTYICAGSTASLTDPTPSGVWTTSDSTIASIDASGTVTGRAAGTAVVSYTVTNSCGATSATASITIETMPNAGVITGDSIICRTGSIPLTETVSGGMWGVTNPAASVIPYATWPSWAAGVYPGRDTITYSVTNVCGTSVATHPVRVVGTTIYLVDYAGPTGCGYNDGRILLTNLNPSTGYTLNYTVSGVAHYDSITSDTSGQFAMTHLIPAYYTYISVTREGCMSNTIADPHATSTIILSDPVINISILDTLDPTRCGASDGLISFTGLIPGAVYDLDYTISGVAHYDSGIVGSTYGNHVMSGLSPGYYTYISVTRNGCRSNTLADPHATSTIIIADPVITIALDGYTHPTTCGANDGTITISGLLAYTNYVLAYEISGVGHWDSITTDYRGRYSMTGLHSGYYTYISVSRDGCMSNTLADPHVSSIIMITDPVITISLAGYINPSYCGGSDGTISISGLIPYTSYTLSYELGDSAIYRTITTDASGNYTLSGLGIGYYSYISVTRAGCMSNTLIDPAYTSRIALTYPPLPAITGPGSVCNGSSANLFNAAAGGIWTSSDTSIAAIDRTTGRATSNRVGSITITYTTVAGCSTTYTLTVNPLANAGTLTGASSICVGATGSMSSTSAGGTWASSNTSVATVSGGRITGVTAGTANISYTATTASCGSATVSRMVTINPLPNVGTISGRSVLSSGQTLYLNNTINGGTWSSSDNRIATINSLHYVTGVSNGLVNISYAMTNSCGTSVVTKQMQVTDLYFYNGKVQNISMCANTLNYALYVQLNTNGAVAGRTLTWTPIVSPSRGALVISGSVSSPGGLRSPANCNYTPTTGYVGNDSFKVRVTDGFNSDTTTVYVQTRSLPATPTISGPRSVCVGSNISLSGAPSSGTWSTNFSPQISFSASGSSASITGVGGPGVAPIIYYNYTDSLGCSSTANYPVAVNIPLAIAGITCSGSGSVVCPGATFVLSHVTPGGTWSSLYPSLATVSSTGAVTALAPGRDTLYYTIANACGIAVAKWPVNILGPTTPTVGGSGAPICVGTSVALSGPSGCTWSHTNPSIASLSSAGLVTGLAAGSDTIICSAVGTCGLTGTGSRVVTVLPTPNPGTLIGPTTVATGNTITLTSTVTGGTWSSTNTSLAIVGVTGIVRGIAVGMDTIKYTVNNTCISATASYVVNVIARRGQTSNLGTTDEAPSIHLYPNPTNGIVTMEIAGSTSEVTATVTDISGKMVYSKTTTERVFDINMSNVAPGMYMVTVHVNGKALQEKIVVQ